MLCPKLFLFFHHLFQIRRCSFVFYFSLSFIVTAVSCNSREQKKYTPSFGIDSSAKKVLLLGVPTHAYGELFSPLVAYFNKHIPGTDIHIVASNSLEDYEQKLNRQYFDFAFVNPYEAVVFEDKGYDVFAKLANDTAYKGVIVVKKGSELKEIADLKGKSICFTNRQALAGTMMPLYFLHVNGLNTFTDFKQDFVGPEEAVILNVHIGRCSAAATWITPWLNFQKSNPAIASQLEVRWVTQPLVNIGLMAKSNANQELLPQLKLLLFNLPKTDEGRKVLTSLSLNDFFVPATASNYIPVKEFMKKYRAIGNGRNK